MSFFLSFFLSFFFLMILVCLCFWFFSYLYLLLSLLVSIIAPQTTVVTIRADLTWMKKVRHKIYSLDKIKTKNVYLFPFENTHLIRKYTSHFNIFAGNNLLFAFLIPILSRITISSCLKFIIAYAVDQVSNSTNLATDHFNDDFRHKHFDHFQFRFRHFFFTFGSCNKIGQASLPWIQTTAEDNCKTTSLRKRN